MIEFYVSDCLFLNSRILYHSLYIHMTSSSNRSIHKMAPGKQRHRRLALILPRIPVLSPPPPPTIIDNSVTTTAIPTPSIASRKRAMNITEEEANKIYIDHVKKKKTFKEIQMETGRSISGISKICKNYEYRKQLLARGCPRNFRDALFKVIKERIQTNAPLPPPSDNNSQQQQQIPSSPLSSRNIVEIPSTILTPTTTTTSSTINEEKDHQICPKGNNFVILDYETILKAAKDSSTVAKDPSIIDGNSSSNSSDKQSPSTVTLSSPIQKTPLSPLILDYETILKAAKISCAARNLPLNNKRHQRRRQQQQLHVPSTTNSSPSHSLPRHDKMVTKIKDSVGGTN